MYDSIRPGQVWLDTEGKRIQAHGGSIFYENDTYYWYGENKEKTVPGGDIWHWGVRAYSSKDLYNWTDEGLIIPPVEDDPSSPLHPTAHMDRPHIIKNDETGKYICWLKIMGEGNTQKETVLQADALLGPYTILTVGLKPLNMNAGDFDLVKAPDGKAYYYFERVHSELICADLTPDYTDVTGYYSTHFPHPCPPFVREAPAYFYRKGKHYLFTSGTTGYHPNPSEVAVADTFHGPWTVLGDPHPQDKSRTSYNSQITSVFKHPHKKDLYIALADRWISALPEIEGDGFADGTAYEYTAELFRRMFSGEGLEGFERRDDGGDANTAEANYVWLPVTFEEGKPVLNWRDEWRIEEF